MRISLFPTAALLFAVLTGSSHAATLGVTLGDLGTDVTYGVGASLNPNVHLSSPAPEGTLTLDNNAQVINPAISITNSYLAPEGTLLDNNYLAVMGTGNPGLATFTLASNQAGFGFTWGSIDLWNTLTITDSRNVTYTITGGDILARLGNPDPGKISTQTDISFSDSFGKIVSVKFGSTQNSFEVANLSTVATPLPDTLVLFGTALVGLVLLARRKQSKA